MGPLEETNISNPRRIKDLRRRIAVKQPFDRVLVVCEGAKTEPNYFNEIRMMERLPTTSIRIVKSTLGTDPLNVVKSAIEEFESTRSFDQVFAVFDRDDHVNYANAIAKAEATNKTLKNDEKKLVPFTAIVSVPSFELWLLLHFEDIQAWIHRDEAFKALRKHIKDYQKGLNSTFSSTKPSLATASKRGSLLKDKNCRLPGNEAYTDVQDLVALLLQLRNTPA